MVSHCLLLRQESKYGRCPGGIKTDILHYFNISDTLYANVLIFKINKGLFKTPTDIIIFAANLPPAVSPYYVKGDLSPLIWYEKLCFLCGVIGYHVTLSEGHMLANHPI